MKPSDTETSAEAIKRFGLEPIPKCVLQLTELVSRQDAALEDVAKVIARDAELKARLLRAANPRAEDESEYGVTTVEEALMRSGLGCVFILAMGAPLMLAVAKTFQTMLSLKLEAVNPKAVRPIVGEHFLAEIRFSGKAEGAVQMRLTIEAAQWIAASILGVPVGELAEDSTVTDAVGEFANIIGGNLKSNLCDAGLGCTLSAPRITRTAEFRTLAVSGGGLERMAFRTTQFNLFVDLTVNPWNE